MKVAYIGVPIALGADRKGVELAPEYFREKEIVNMIDNIVGCYDLGNIHSSIIDEQIYNANDKVKFLETVVDVNNQLRNKIASVARQKYFPLVVGGDHSLGLGSCAGMALEYEDLCVVWFDAHGDFNTEESSPSGNAHGMPCAALMGWCKSELNNVPIKKIPSQNFYWVGTRDLDDGEKQLAQKYGLHIYSSKCVRLKGIEYVMNDIISDIQNKGNKHIHLSIDIDGMDPQIITGTGTKVSDGMWNSDFYTFLDKIFSTGNVVSTDFVEYNHMLDDKDETTAKWCTEALHYIAIKIRNNTK